jgi:thiol:disulfide interchange protein DsbC
VVSPPCGVHKLRFLLTHNLPIQIIQPALLKGRFSIKFDEKIMFKKIFPYVAIGTLFLSSISANAEQLRGTKVQGNPAALITNTSPKADISEATNALGKMLKEKFPQNPAPKSIAPTQVPGVFELLVDDQIAYVDATGTYFFLNAAMVDLKNQVNYTNDRKNILLKINPSELDIKDALVHKKGSGKRQLFVFSDPFCSFCHQLEKELAKLTDVTIITFIIPRPDARAVAQSIWCASNREEAWDGYMATRIAPAVKTCDNPIERNIALSKKLNVNGTPALFTADGRRMAGYAPVEQIQTFLNQ